MKISKTLQRSILFGVLIFLAALIGPRVAHGYIHPADPLILLAALYLPLPHALVTAGAASVLVDLLKGLYLLSPATLIIKLLMVLLAYALLKTKFSEKHPEIAMAPALFLPVAGYYLAELLYRLIIGAGWEAFSQATITLKADLLQAVASILILIFVYDMIKGISDARAQMRKAKEAKQQEEEAKE